MLKLKHSAQEGRTFIETLAYIMIMITVTASIASVVSRSYYRYECSAVQQDLTDLHKAIVKHYAVDGHYSKVSWDDLCEDNLGPKSMMPERVCTGEGNNMKCKCKRQKGRHIFEGPVDIGPSDCRDGSCSTFYIVFDDLPQDVCAQLGTKSWTTIAGSDLERMEINKTLWYWKYSPILGDAALIKKELPAQVEDIAEACHEGYDNKITWYFN